MGSWKSSLWVILDIACVYRGCSGFNGERVVSAYVCEYVRMCLEVAKVLGG